MFLGLEPADGVAGTLLFIRFSVIAFLMNRVRSRKQRDSGPAAKYQAVSPSPVRRQRYFVLKISTTARGMIILDQVGKRRRRGHRA
jgi:hypothetical protein